MDQFSTPQSDAANIRISMSTPLNDVTNISSSRGVKRSRDEGIPNIDPVELLRMKRREKYANLSAEEKDNRRLKSPKNYHRKKAMSISIHLRLSPTSGITVDGEGTLNANVQITPSEATNDEKIMLDWPRARIDDLPKPLLWINSQFYIGMKILIQLNFCV
ncbi:hypothetical protein C2845_PM17G12570 [Panicum miliaceum]|uniref:Uncharacterized protein n=1 Tax=Panicum miliaceum TaxID=4540 RepID=A0A3L6Q399_PANMI|nr:hypothetical protein C2845_PM17G12570 [Panicum miliaceum]